MILAWLLGLQGALAAPPCGGPCGDDVACGLEQGRCLVERGDWPGALEVLKGYRSVPLSPPQASLAARLLSSAYQGAGNQVWARRVLVDQVVADPSDLDTRTWAAWVAMQQGDVLQARQLLSIPVPDQGPLAQRLRLLQAALAAAEGRPDVAGTVLEGPAAALAPGDEILRQEVRRRVSGDPREPFSARIQGSGGYSSNPVQSAPQDLGTVGQEAGSPVVLLDGVLRYEPAAHTWIRPTAEARVKGLLPFTEATRSSAWLDLAGRGGMEVGRLPSGLHTPKEGGMGDSRVRLLYSYELLGVNSGDAYHSTAPAPQVGGWPGQRWYMEAHRGELEADLGSRFQVFGGAGRRIYREMGRTRTEGDGGLALAVPFAEGWNFTGILSGRLQDARSSDWDLWGGTALMRVAAPLPGANLLLVRGMVLGDRYDASNPEGRRDLTGSLQVAPWTRSIHGVRYGASWTWTDRQSSVSDWSYTDHRVLLEARWQPSWGSRKAPLAPVPSDFLPLPYGLERASDGGLDRVQDLLRQEDSARRGSSCAD